MAHMQKQLPTFPSVYSKDYQFFRDFTPTERWGSFEAFILGPEDAALFREPVSKSADKQVDEIELKDIQDDDPNFMKTIYMSDYKGEKPKSWKVEECIATLMEGVLKRTERPKRLPLTPLVSSLRVLPGVARYYHLPRSEFEDTISQVGLLRFRQNSSKT